jgi:hypothetical protein
VQDVQEANQAVGDKEEEEGNHAKGEEMASSRSWM